MRRQRIGGWIQRSRCVHPFRRLRGGALPRHTVIALACLFAASPACSADPSVSPVKSDETVILFPTVGLPVDGGKAYEIAVHGWIFEPHSLLDSLIDLKTRLELDDDDEEDDSAHERDDEADDNASAPTEHANGKPAAAPAPRRRDIFKARARYFLVDNERGKAMVVSTAGQTFTLGESESNGHFKGRLSVTWPPQNVRDEPPRPVDSPKNDDPRRAKPGAAVRDAGLRLHVVLKPEDPRTFDTQVYLLDDTGVSVISDIDDTIKITQVRDRKACVKNTFVRPFRAVPGMAEVYQAWASQGATVHYVSAGPWQLFVPLRDFLTEAGFPAGPFSMKQFRLKDESFLDLFKSPDVYKVTTIEPLLQRCPKRRFILVGDSGEKDPEAYGELARRFPDRVTRIYIRDVTGDPRDSDRYRQAFRDVPPERWRLFKDAKEIEHPLPNAPTTQPTKPRP